MRKAIPIFWKVFFAGLGFFVLLLILINFGVFGSLPSLKELENPSIMLASEVYADDGTPCFQQKTKGFMITRGLMVWVCCVPL